MQEPRDKIAYRMVVGGIGLALIVTLAGICVILAVNPFECESDCSSKSPQIPSELWKIVSALGGGLLGILAPSPTKQSKRHKQKTNADNDEVAAGGKTPQGKTWPTTAGSELGGNLTVLALLIVFVLSAGFGIGESSNELQSLAAASGAALLGLLAPTPAHTESEHAGPSGIES